MLKNILLKLLSLRFSFYFKNDMIHIKNPEKLTTIEDEYIETSVEKVEPQPDSPVEEVEETVFLTTFINDNSDQYDDILVEQRIKKAGYLDSIEWIDVSSNSRLSEEFMVRYKDDINWALASRRQYFSPEFIDEHSDLLEYQSIIRRFLVSPSYIDSIVERYKLDHVNKDFWLKIVEKQNITDEFVKKYKKYLRSDDIALKMLQGKYKGINSLSDDFITFDGMFDKASTNGEIKVLKKHYMLKLENNVNYLKNDEE